MDERYNQLLLKSMSEQLTPQEEEELYTFVSEDKVKMAEYLNLRDLDTLFNMREGAPEEQVERLRKKLSLHIRDNRRRTWLQYAAVLIPIFLVLSITLYYFTSSSSTLSTDSQDLIVSAKNIMPGEGTAYLSAGKDTVALQGSHSNTKEVDKLIASNEAEIRTVTVPRGGEYNITLPDGTTVWLNSDSRLSYPSKFGEGERNVELEGEAFFEVTPNKSNPFIVKTKDVYTKVLGTSFSLSAYKNEGIVKNILVTGVVELKVGEHTTRLEPGNKGEYNEQSGEIEVAKVDIRKATALKEGRFFFDDEPLKEIFLQLSRWYNIDIEIGSIEIANTKFFGMIRKDRDFSFIVEMMQEAYKLDFKIEGKKVFVTKK